jgi:hypothetical protein
VFATPERNLWFDVNDFDETLPAPVEWDVKRLAASVVVVGRQHGVDEGRLPSHHRGQRRGVPGAHGDPGPSGPTGRLDDRIDVDEVVAIARGRDARGSSATWRRPATAPTSPRFRSTPR